MGQHHDAIELPINYACFERPSPPGGFLVGKAHRSAGKISPGPMAPQVLPSFNAKPISVALKVLTTSPYARSITRQLGAIMARSTPAQIRLKCIS